MNPESLLLYKKFLSDALALGCVYAVMFALVNWIMALLFLVALKLIGG